MLGQDGQNDVQVRMSEALEKVANEHGKDITVTAVALAYALQKSPYVFPVRRFSNPPPPSSSSTRTQADQIGECIRVPARRGKKDRTSP